MVLTLVIQMPSPVSIHEHPIRVVHEPLQSSAKSPGVCMFPCEGCTGLPWEVKSGLEADMARCSLRSHSHSRSHYYYCYYWNLH
jgi:hypothetical protein